MKPFFGVTWQRRLRFGTVSRRRNSWSDYWVKIQTWLFDRDNDWIGSVVDRQVVTLRKYCINLPGR
jgi:hypothetical protein